MKLFRSSHRARLLPNVRLPIRRLFRFAPGRTEQIRVLPVSRAFGLDVSDTSLEAVELRLRRGKPTLSAYSRVLLEPGVIANGEIIYPEQLRTALKTLLKEARPEPFSPKAVVSVPESKVYLYTFEFPVTLSPKKVREAIPYEVQGVLPIELTDMVTDLLFHRSREGTTQHVLFAAAPKKLADQYLELLTSVGIEPVTFETESSAIVRSLVGVQSDPVLLIDVGAHRATLIVVEWGEVHGAVSMPVGGTTITETIASVGNRSLEDADYLKMTTGLTDETPPEIRRAVEERLRLLFHEVNQFLRSHEGHTGRSIQEIVLAGGSALMPGLDAAIAGSVKRPVRVGDPFTTPEIQFPARLSKADREWLRQGRIFFAPSIGLALRGARANAPEGGINLLPPSLRRRYLLWRENLTLTVLSLLTLSAGTVLFLVLTLSLLQAQLSARRVRAEVASVRSTLESDQLKSAAAEATAVNQEAGAIRAFAEQRVNPLPHLERIRGAILQGIRLAGVEIAVAAGAQESFTVKLNGIADAREQFLDFERRIRALPGVQTVDSPLTNLDQPLAVPFILTLTVAATPTAPAVSPPAP